MKRYLLVLLFFPALGFAQSIELISHPDVVPANGDRSNYRPRLDDEGRYVVFESRDASVPEFKSKFRAVFISDRLEKTIRKIDADELERSDAGPSISPDGRYVCYHSYPLNFGMPRPPARADIYIYSVQKQKSELQTFGRKDSPNGECLNSVLSRDGRFLLFTSNATNFFEAPAEPVRNIYLYDRDLNHLENISTSQLGMAANRSSGDPHMSVDGRFVAFKSAATNLIRLDPLGDMSQHLFLVDRDTHSMVQVDEPTKFDLKKYFVGRFDMDASGETIVFEGRPHKFKDPDDVLRTADLFVFSRSSGTITRLTKGIFAERSGGPSISADGRFVAFILKGDGRGDRGGLIVYDRSTDAYKRVVEGPCYNPDISGNGHVIGFESDKRDLVPGAPAGVRNVYVVGNPFLE